MCNSMSADVASFRNCETHEQARDAEAPSVIFRQCTYQSGHIELDTANKLYFKDETAQRQYRGASTASTCYSGSRQMWKYNMCSVVGCLPM